MALNEHWQEEPCEASIVEGGMRDMNSQETQLNDWSSVSNKDLEKIFEYFDNPLGSLIENNALYKFFEQRHKELSSVAGTIIAQNELLEENKLKPEQKAFTEFLEKEIENRGRKKEELFNEWEMLKATLIILNKGIKIPLEEKNAVKLFLLNTYHHYSVQNVIQS